MKKLGPWLVANNRRRCSGIWDCCAAPAAWAIDNGHADPMQEWRGEYASEDEGEEFIAKAGGLIELFDKGMNSAGIAETSDVKEGNIGILQIGEHEAGAIYTGKRWALVTDRGWLFVSMDNECVLKMWAV